MKQELLDYPGKIGALFASLRDDELWHLINVDINYFCFEMISFETERWNWWFLTHLCLFNFVEWLTIWALKYCICSYLTLGNIFSNNVVTLTTNIIYIASSYNEWFNLTAILSIYWSCSFLRFRCNPTVYSSQFSSPYFQGIIYLRFFLFWFCCFVFTNYYIGFATFKKLLLD